MKNPEIPYANLKKEHFAADTHPKARETCKKNWRFKFILLENGEGTTFEKGMEKQQNSSGSLKGQIEYWVRVRGTGR